jgi:hypothetical protein
MIVVLVLVAVPASVIAGDKGGQLRQTMADIALLNSQLVQRQSEAAEIRDALAARLATIKAEAVRHAREGSIKSEDAALKAPRLRYNLMLIAEIEAYIARYTQKIGYFRVACDRLSYLYQQADDDLKIVTTLSGLKVDALISQAEKTIDEYLADSQALVIRADTMTIASPEKIWGRIHDDI